MLVALCVLEAVAVFWLVHASVNQHYHRLWVKLLACSGFVLIAIYTINQHTPLITSWLMLLGLLLSWFGDMLLGSYRIIRRFRIYIMGVICFFFAQCTYIAGFSTIEDPFILPFLFAALCIAYLISQRHQLTGNYVNLYPIIYFYGFSLGFAGGYGVQLLFNQSITWVLPAGIILFLASDCILFQRFRKSGRQKWHEPAYLILYNLGQSLIALSLLWFR
ncbi:MAG: lysoplasmalogenase [Erysipelotrichaceae bacterium]|jgi:uncharacterized membrane protein YhhN|nr:lysoplasmalogenase [Erysipelotrichaceae bacterium]